MLHPALFLLMRLQTRAVFRRTLRGLRSPKKLVFIVVAGLVFLMWLGPTLFAVGATSRTDPHAVRAVAPLILLLMCMLTLFGGAGDRVISFTPGEVNFLFPGPFTRRQLLFYKLARTLGGALVSGSIFSVVLLRHASMWPAAFVGGVLAMMLVQFLTLSLAMIAQSIGARAYTIGRRVALGVVLAGVALALGPGVRDMFGGGLSETLHTLQHSTPARVALAPFVPFTHTFTATTWAELVLWGGVSAALNLALLLLVIRLDADYREAALAASERTFERRRRARRGEILARVGGRAGTPRRTRFKMFPWLGGAGPTAWRQLTVALRTSRGILLFLLLLSIGVAPALFVTQHHLVPVILAAIWLTVFLTMVLRFDFRAELEQMDWLKALPLSPTATAAGQIAVPVFILTTVQAILLGYAAAIAEPDQRPFILAALAFLLPFNVLMMAVENLLFLLFPARQVGAAPGDVAMMGRQVVFFMLKLLIVAAACGVVAVFGVAAALSLGITAGVVTALITLCVVAAATVPCVGQAYRRFDPSADTPA